MQNPATTKKKEFPDTLVILFGFMLVVAILSYILPAGAYNMIKSSTGKNMVDAASFHFIQQSPVTLSQFFTSPFRGIKISMSTMTLIIMMGGAFNIIIDTKSIDLGFHNAAQKLQYRALLLIPIVMIICYILGALQIVVNSIVAFIPIGIVLCKQLHLDPLAVVLILVVPVNIGFGSTPMGAFSVLIAQSIAELPPLSGFGYRATFGIICLVVDILVTMAYCKKVYDNPAKSSIGVYEENEEMTKELQSVPFTWKHALILIATLFSFALYAWGSFYHDWGMDMQGATVLAAALFAGILMKMSPNEIVRSFMTGAKGNLYGGLLTGIASAVLVLLQDGHIIHTLVYYASIPLSHMSSHISALGMLLFNYAINLMVPSGSGQAYLVMPLMTPMADVLKISRQVAVLAFQYGDGFGNLIIPTSSALMGSLGMLNISYPEWMKFFGPRFIIFFLISCASVMGAVLIGLQ